MIQLNWSILCNIQNFPLSRKQAISASCLRTSIGLVTSLNIATHIFTIYEFCIFQQAQLVDPAYCQQVPTWRKLRFIRAMRAEMSICTVCTIAFSHSRNCIFNYKCNNVIRSARIEIVEWCEACSARYILKLPECIRIW